MDNNLTRPDQFDDLPLPDMEESWQKMKEVLEKYKEDRKPVIPFFLKSCAGWGIALLILGGLTWFAIKEWGNKNSELQRSSSSINKPSSTDNNNLKQNNSDQSNNTSAKSITGNASVNDVSDNEPENPGKDGRKTDSKNNSTVTTSDLADVDIKNKRPEKKLLIRQEVENKPVEVGDGHKNKMAEKPAISLAEIGKIRDNATDKKSVYSSIKKTRNKTIDAEKGVIAEQKLVSKAKVRKGQRPVDYADDKTDQASSRKAESDQHNPRLPVTNETQTNTNPDSNHISKSDTALMKDTLTIANKIADTVQSKTATVKQKKKRNLIFSAGVGLQQQIPISNQKGTPYDYYGRKSSLSDYIPSVYARMAYKKWFLQGEFRYGAPQSLEEFSYGRKTTIVDSGTVLATTTYNLKKTYYHQIPLSINYFVLPHLSVGAGVIYSRFHGAVTEKQVDNKNLQTQAETFSREIVNVKEFNDSFLYKTQVHFLVQAEYHWRRFTFGLRYTRDLQPYIRFITPEGEEKLRRNNTLQAMVRFRLWELKRK